MLTYSDVSGFVTTKLTALGYGTAGHPAMPLLDPGPATIDRLRTMTPGAMIFLVVGNGIGLVKEGLYDQPFIMARVLGPQRDYTTAETLAQDLDRMMLAVVNQTVGSTRTLYINRNAPPQLVDYDAADRYHFQTTYIAEART